MLNEERGFGFRPSEKTEGSGYPYTGGMYGGYKNPANNKPSTLVGPTADQAIKQTGQALASNVTSAIGGYRSSVNDTLEKTKKAYEVGGVPAAVGQYARGTVADAGLAVKNAVVDPIVKPTLGFSRGLAQAGKTFLTGDATPIGAGQASTSVQVKPALATRPEQVQAGNAPSEAIDYLKRNPNLHQEFKQKFGYLPDGFTRPALESTPAKPFQTTLANGITYSGGQEDGSRVFTVGTRGQDGYGYMKVKSGQNLDRPTAKIGFHGSQQQAGKVPGYSFEGTAEDAAKFSAPVARPAPTPATLGMQGGDYRQVRAAHEAAKGSQPMPEYIGPEGGWGWKGRGEIYRAQLADRLSRDNNAMQEGGADRRAMIQASGVSDRNILDAARLGLEHQKFAGEQGMQALDMQGKQLELGYSKDMAEARRNLANLKPGTPEYAEAERRYGTLLGRSLERKPEIEKLKVEGPNGGSSERLVRMNPDGTVSEVRMPPSAAALSAHRYLLSTMDDKQRRAHLEELARSNPDMFAALRAGK